jgi:8-amino-7-oxononanoate synthase
MDGDCAPLETLFELAERYGAGLIVDEAHATAVHGPSGRGLASAARIEEHVWAIVHTCGKALASAGAFVCGSAVLKQLLINRARTFIFSTALPPYMARQVQGALRLAQQMNAERAALLDRARRFSAALRADGWDTSGSDSQIVPIIIGDNAEALAAAAHLQSEGFAVRAIRPPTVPEGRSRLRLSLTSEIPENGLDRLRGALGMWREDHVCGTSAGRV